jgi:hypothetical protein
MRLWRGWWVCGCGLAVLGVLCAFQKPFRQYPGVEYESFETPPDANVKAEWAFARLMFPPGENDGYSSTGRFTGDWRLGLSLWTQDYPRADRHFSLAMKRLTRLHVRSVEQPVNLDEDEEFDYPWLYAVQVGEWGLTDKQAAEMREYLLRGGFFVADDFHGAFEWEMFEQRIKKVFPDRPIVDISDDDPIFHVIYDLNDRYQVPGAAHIRMGYKRPDYPKGPDDGKGARWRGIFDDKGRIMVAISYNSDLGDAWEWADEPRYPAKFSDLAIRVGVNYVIYAMTH